MPLLAGVFFIILLILVVSIMLVVHFVGSVILRPTERPVSEPRRQRRRRTPASGADETSTAEEAATEISMLLDGITTPADLPWFDEVDGDR